LGPDKKRLSKRHGATAVEHYRAQGILPAALINYLALLGWSPGADREIMEISEMIARFGLERVNKANAVFDAAKLEWINAQHLQQMEIDKLAERVGQSLAEQGLAEQLFVRDAAAMRSAVALLRSRCKTLNDFGGWGKAFFSDDFPTDVDGRNKYLSDPSVPAALQELSEKYQALAEFTLESTEQTLRQLAAEKSIKPGALIGAVRVALTGNPVAPSLFEVILYLGRDRTVARLRQAAGVS
jgi:glutamyl-tRNA synthetase